MKIKLLFFKNAEYTNWGLKSCSHGMYIRGYDFYAYGVKYILNLIILK